MTMRALELESCTVTFIDEDIVHTHFKDDHLVSVEDVQRMFEAIEAERCRHAYLEARAEWLLRSVTYRMGDDRPIDEELLDAVEALGARHLVALVAFVEATHGYRRRDARVGELARRSHAAALTLGDGLGLLLAGALATAVGELTDDEQRRELHRAACASDVPGIGIQTAALLVEGGGPCPDEATIARLAGTVPRAHWSKRMELLSVDEALARLRR